MNGTQARGFFPLTRRHIFLNHAGISPLSDRVRAALNGLAEELTLRPPAYDTAEQAAEHLRRGLARLLNVPSETLAITRGTAHGLSLLAQGLAWQPGDNVVGADGEHPANVYPWMALAGRGVEYRRAPLEAGKLTPDTVFSLVDDRTRVVALSHVQFGNGCRLDLDTIGRECDRRGVLFAVDASQSAGALRLDLSRLPVDFLAATACKWLMGPVGIGFCYGRPELLKRLSPPVIGMGTASTPAVGSEWIFHIRDDARRFEESSISPLDTVAFGVAVDLLLEVGARTIEEQVLTLSRQLGEGLAARGYEVVEPWPRRIAQSSGIVSFRRPSSPAHQVLRDLQAAGIVGRLQSDYVRLSPHFYNTKEDLEHVLDVLQPLGAALP